MMRVFGIWCWGLLLVNCGNGGTDEGKKGATMDVNSPAFKAGEKIPAEHTGEGKNISPPLAWSGVPESAKSLALICDDPDALRKEPWVHWVIGNIPAAAKGLLEDVGTEGRPKKIEGAVQGKNDGEKIGYSGPMPPKGHGVHHYHFKVYALDALLDLKEGMTKSDLLAAMKGHILAQGELVGTYERKE